MNSYGLRRPISVDVRHDSIFVVNSDCMEALDSNSLALVQKLWSI